MMDPDPRGIIWRAAAFAVAMVPTTCESRVARNVSRSVSGGYECSALAPALQTAMSSGPAISAIRSVTSVTWSGFVVSSRIASHAHPRARISAAASSTTASRRPAMNVWAPWAARACAMALPRWVPPPVTRATRPVRSKSSDGVVNASGPARWIRTFVAHGPGRLLARLDHETGDGLLVGGESLGGKRGAVGAVRAAVLVEDHGSDAGDTVGILLVVDAVASLARRLEFFEELVPRSDRVGCAGFELLRVEEVFERVLVDVGEERLGRGTNVVVTAVPDGEVADPQHLGPLEDTDDRNVTVTPHRYVDGLLECLMEVVEGVGQFRGGSDRRLVQIGQVADSSAEPIAPAGKAVHVPVGLQGPQ